MRIRNQHIKTARLMIKPSQYSYKPYRLNEPMMFLFIISSQSDSKCIK